MDCEDVEICVKFPRYSNKLRFVTVNINNINKNELVKKALEIFRVPNNSTELQVRLTDNRNASIPEHKLTQILRQFHRSASFFIQMDFVDDLLNDFVPKIITPEMISFYIERNGAERVLEYLNRKCDDTENDGINELPVDKDDVQNVLPVELRINFVNCLADYTVSLFGLHPTENQLKNIAQSAIALVPSLASKGSGSEIDILVNKVNGGSGYLYNRLRYLRTKEKNQSKKNSQTVNGTKESASSKDDNQNVDEHNQIATNTDHVTHEPYKMDDLLVLKTIIVNEKNMPEIHDKLRLTLERRRELLTTGKVNLLEHFPCMFVHPSLVLFDFALLFPLINSNAFIELWPSISKKLVSVFRQRYKNKQILTDWPSNVEDFLILLRLLPYQSKGDKSKERGLTFPNAIKRFMVFSKTIEDALPDLSKIKNQYPVIVACGKKEDHISHYIIAIDNQSMHVPKGFSFEETVDLFFKMHYVFSLEFDPRMENVFLFMEHYIYKMEEGEKRPYTAMIELSNLII